MTTALVWLRRDLRLADNPALAAALTDHERVIAAYVHAPHEEGAGAPGGASRWWLHHALCDLNGQLGGRLWIGRGDSLAQLSGLIEREQVRSVHWNRCYEPAIIARDTRVEQALRGRGLTVTRHHAALLFEPREIRTRQGGPFKVFTPFWRTCLAAGLPAPYPAPPDLDRLACAAGGLKPQDLSLLPRIPWDQGLRNTWQPTRAGALARLQGFVSGALAGYAAQRDRPARDASSRLAPWLHFGQLGVRELAAACQARGGAADAYLRQLGWREFAHHLLFHFPHTPAAPLNPLFGALPWRDDPRQLAAWQQGRTGIPMVDAGLRELWHTGWMHNRARMLAASFLAKNLLLPWQAGAAWFMDTLVDADLANNTLGWQWCAGCGADAAPWFRIFNPVLQGRKFDSGGSYVRHWVPELAGLGERWIHAPWEAPARELERAGVRLERDYPAPLVDLKATRERALAVWAGLRKNRPRLTD